MASTVKCLTLECGLVSTGVKLCAASKGKDLYFGRAVKGDDGVVRQIRRIDVPDPGPEAKQIVVDQVQRDKGGKIKQAQFWGEPLSGVWDGEEFYEITRDEIEKIEALTVLDTITIQEFVPLADVPWERAQGCYFLTPENPVTGAVRQLATLAKAMEDEGVVGVVKVCPGSRQKLGIVYPCHGGLLLSTLAYSEAFREFSEGAASFEGAEINPQALDLARQLIETMRADADTLDLYRDDLIELRADLMERAKLGEPLTVPEKAEPEKAAVGGDSLEKRLRESVRIAKRAKRKTATEKRKPSRKASGATSTGRAVAAR